MIFGSLDMFPLMHPATGVELLKNLVSMFSEIVFCLRVWELLHMDSDKNFYTVDYITWLNRFSFFFIAMVPCF